MAESVPKFDSPYGNPIEGMDMPPKPTGRKLPLLLTGSSQQSPDWVARHGDGWMTYPRATPAQANVVRDWRQHVMETSGPAKPAMQLLYVDLVDDTNATPHLIYLRFRMGTNLLLSCLKSLEAIGINHVAINLRFNQADIETTLKNLASATITGIQLRRTKHHV